MARGKQAAAAVSRRARAELEAELASAKDTVQSLRFELDLAKRELAGRKAGAATFVDIDRRSKDELEAEARSARLNFDRIAAQHNHINYKLALHFEGEHGLTPEEAIRRVQRFTAGIVVDRAGIPFGAVDAE